MLVNSLWKVISVYSSIFYKMRSDSVFCWFCHQNQFRDMRSCLFHVENLNPINLQHKYYWIIGSSCVFCTYNRLTPKWFLLINTQNTSAAVNLTLQIDLYHCLLLFLFFFSPYVFKACSELRAKQQVQKAARRQTNWERGRLSLGSSGNERKKKTKERKGGMFTSVLLGHCFGVERGLHQRRRGKSVWEGGGSFGEHFGRGEIKDKHVGEVKVVQSSSTSVGLVLRKIWTFHSIFKKM